jgi:hypothetical protein
VEADVLARPTLLKTVDAALAKSRSENLAT